MSKDQVNKSYLNKFVVTVGAVFILIAIICSLIGWEKCYVIFLSIGCSIIASLIYSALISEKEKSLEKKIFDKLNLIEDIASDKMILLCNKDRRNLIGRGFYDDLYNRADEIGICGTDLSNVIGYICDFNSLRYSKNKEHWVKKLSERKGIRVTLVMPYPNEHNLIQTRINQLKRIIGNKNNNKLAKGSSIQVFLTQTPIFFSISYSHTINDYDKDTMLFALLVNNKDEGPVFQIKRTFSNTYDELKKHLDSLAENGHLLFRWNENGIQYYDYENATSQKSR